MRTSLWILGLLLVGVVAPFWWSPYSAAGRIGVAIDERDAAVLGQCVDFARLQRDIAANVREHFSMQRSASLKSNPQILPVLETAVDEFYQQNLQAELTRRTGTDAIQALIRQALGGESQDTRFDRAVRLLRADAVEWRSDSSVRVRAAGDTRLLMVRSGLVWRVVGLEFPEPTVKLLLVTQ